MQTTQSGKRLWSSLAEAEPVVHDKFKLIKDRTNTDFKLRFHEYEHIPTGARVLSVVTKDDNKVFGIGFPTPPDDSAGIPHILEHSVLAGSENYPLRDPFMSMYAGSLQTFLNAMTYSDLTLYPVASVNQTDYYNLASVYADAVLRPLVIKKPDAFRREGTRLTLNEVDGEVGVSGVVYNEMQGMYSNPIYHLYRESMAALYPDTPLRFNSGGDPAEIRHLTWERLVDFHKRHYNVSNAHFFFFGDEQNLKDRLDFVDKQTQGLTPNMTRSSIVPEPKPFSAPVRSSFQIMSSAAQAEGEDGAAKPPASPEEADAILAKSKEDVVAISWIVPRSVITPEVSAVLSALSSGLLVGTPVSPMHLALQEAGVGDEVFFMMDDSTADWLMMLGVRGVQSGPEGKAKVALMEKIVQEQLEKAVKEGFQADRVEAVVNAFEFSTREFATPGEPRGVAIFRSLAPGWIGGRLDDKIDGLNVSEAMANVRAKLSSGLLEDTVRKLFLENTHRATVHGQASLTKAEEDRLATEAFLADAAAALTKEDREKLVEQTKADIESAGKTEPPEIQALLPSLKRSDLSRTPPDLVWEPTLKTLTVENGDLSGESVLDPQTYKLTRALGQNEIPVLTTEMDCNGITYLNFNVDITEHVEDFVRSFMQGDNVATAPVTEKALTEAFDDIYLLMSLLANSGITSGLSRQQQRDEILTHTGGLRFSAKLRRYEPAEPQPPGVNQVMTVEDRSRGRVTLGMKVKALDSKVEKGLSILVDALANPVLTNRQTALELLKAKAQGARSDMVDSGNSVASQLLSSGESAVDLASNMIGNSLYTYPRYTAAVKKLEAMTDTEFEAEFAPRLAAAHQRILDAVASADARHWLVDAATSGPEQTKAAVAAVKQTFFDRLRQDIKVSSAAAALKDKAAAASKTASLWTGIHADTVFLSTGIASAADPSKPETFPREPAQYRGVEIPSLVNFVGAAGRVFQPGEKVQGAGALAAATNWLRIGPIMQRVRQEGGAYGASVSLDVNSGLVTFSSYRDPQNTGTLAAFRSAVQDAFTALKSGSLTERDVERATIGYVGQLDQPQQQEARAGVNLARLLLQSGPARRQANRESVLGLSSADFERMATLFSGALEEGKPVAQGGPAVVFMSPKTVWADAKQTLGAPIDVKQPFQAEEK